MAEGVVIVGGGLAAQRCAETLRRGGYEGRVRIVCGERHRPYDRPPLSKELLAPGADAAFASLRAAEWYGEKSVELITGVRASALDPVAHCVELDDGSALHFDHLVAATGARPRTLPELAPYANVSTLRTLEDSSRLRELLGDGRRLVIIGAGFVGLEVAAAARAVGAPVAVIELASQPLGGVLGAEVGDLLVRLHRSAGVELFFETEVSEIEGAERVEALTLSNGVHVSVDHLLVAIGVAPDLAWLSSSGLPTSGVPTDLGGRSALPDVYAAGDAAAFYDPFLERHALIGHWEAASRQGAAVARSILGEDQSPAVLSSFWSDQYGMRIQYLGHAALADEVTIEGELNARDFVAHYNRAGQLVAAVVVGRPRVVPELRDRLSYLTEGTAV
jgi:3-phenylpropionate/trans-cinnamate dioxygenase ferredoxin reductase subunit